MKGKKLRDPFLSYLLVKLHVSSLDWIEQYFQICQFICVLSYKVWLKAISQ